MNEHQFKLNGRWTGGLKGEGKIHAGALESSISVPKSLQGPGVGTNPEELLLGAAGTCYLITLAAILERRKIEVKTIELTSEGYVSTEAGLKFTRIVHRPVLRLVSGDPSAAHEAAERAEKACLISNAIRGNVEVTVVPEIRND